MRGHCIICAELFVSSSEISAITCGHTFHYLCLSQWTERSKTCPQCRIKLNHKSVIQKLYFDAGPDLEPEEDPDVLRNTNNDLEVQVKKKDKEIASLLQTFDMHMELNEDLKKKRDDYKSRLKQEQDLTASLKMQLEHLSKENTRTKKLEQENVILTTKLKDCQNMGIILNGSDEEAKEILKSYGRGKLQMEQLALYCGVLKSELTTISNQKQCLVTKSKQLEKKLSRKCDLEESVNRLLSENEQKDRRIHLLEEKLRNEDSKNKLWLAGSSKRRSKDIIEYGTLELTSSPSLTAVASNKENDSPAIAHCSVAASIARDNEKMFRVSHLAKTRKVEAEAYKNFNIMNRAKPVYLNSKPSSAAGSSNLKEQGYDGMGGHSRPDIFPNGTAQAKRKIKIAVSSKASRVKTVNSVADTIMID